MPLPCVRSCCRLRIEHPGGTGLSVTDIRVEGHLPSGAVWDEVLDEIAVVVAFRRVAVASAFPRQVGPLVLTV